MTNHYESRYIDFFFAAVITDFFLVHFGAETRIVWKLSESLMQKMHSKEMENQQKEKWEMTNEIASQVL